MQIAVITFRLRYPERGEWQYDIGYNRLIQCALIAARDLIAWSSSPLDYRIEAEELLLEQIEETKSRRQQMLLYYLLAHCGRMRDLNVPEHFERVLRWCTLAEEIANDLADLGALVDIHELSGTACRAISLFAEAADHFATALTILREHAQDNQSLDPAFEVALTAKTAILDYLIGNFERAVTYVQRASSLLPLVEEDVLGQATIAWTFALLYRQRNELDKALDSVEAAAALYHMQQRNNSTCRILSLAAEIVMDMAEATGSMAPTLRDERLKEARNYAETALSVGEQSDDREGVQLVYLSLARLKAIQSSTKAEEADEEIRRVVRWARANHDEALLSNAQTARGANFLVRRDRDEASRWLRKAVATAKRIRTPGLGYRAERYLRLMDGRNA